MSKDRCQTTIASSIEGLASQHLPELLTIDEVAQLLRVCRTTVYEQVRTGNLPSHRVGRNIRIARSALQQFLGMRKESE